ncbi:MAG: hypothetical protein ACKOOI_18875, partial [Pirellula sp.]
ELLDARVVVRCDRMDSQEFQRCGFGSLFFPGLMDGGFKGYRYIVFAGNKIAGKRQEHRGAFV